MTLIELRRTHNGRRFLLDFDSGVKARREGLPRTPPYKGSYFSRMYMERAWLLGYDASIKRKTA